MQNDREESEHLCKENNNQDPDQLIHSRLLLSPPEQSPMAITVEQQSLRERVSVAAS